jgi:TonB family protein
MPEVADAIEAAETEQPVSDLRLLVVPDSGFQIFLQNLRELFRKSELSPVEGDAAAFWPDVFVERRLPWLQFLQSGAYHVLAILMIWAGSRILALQPHIVPQPVSAHADVVYYTPSEYLPPIDTRRANSARTAKANPEYSAQPIISLPPEAENRTQTVVTPPKIKLSHEVALPNVVAWNEKSRMPIGPAPLVPASETERIAPRMEESIVAPPPDVEQARMAREIMRSPQTAVIAPPPTATESIRRPGDLNIGRSTVIAPAPQLSLSEQRAGRTASALGGRAVKVIAPPPSVGAPGGARSGRSMIALNLHPAVTAPSEPVAGNRRGSFAATPKGRPGASGAVGGASGAGKNAASSAGKTSSGLPSGLYVGKSRNAPSATSGDGAAKPDSYTVNPNLIASARPPRVSARRLQPESDSKLSDEERAVFGDRKFYSLSLNMPNLNSAGGSWIIRFAALKPDSDSSDASIYARAAASASSAGAVQEELSAPTATRKIDPAYPLELMRQNVGGTVILYAVIHRDGRVGGIRVLRSADERLARYASQAVARWQFEPATRNGTPIDVEATFWIPFLPVKTNPGF